MNYFEKGKLEIQTITDKFAVTFILPLILVPLAVKGAVMKICMSYYRPDMYIR